MTVYNEFGKRVPHTHALRAATLARISLLTTAQCQQLLAQLQDSSVYEAGGVGGLQRAVLVNYNARYLSAYAIEIACREDSRNETI